MNHKPATTPPPPTPASLHRPVPPPPGANQPKPQKGALTLRARMVTLIVLLLAVGLAISTVTATTMLKNNLLSDLDRQLITTASSASNNAQIGPNGYFFTAGTLPSNYFFLLRDAQNRTIGTEFQIATVNKWGQPDVPELTEAEITQQAGAPFTVPGTVLVPHKDANAAAAWRVAVYPVLNPYGAYDGSFTVALPLDTITDTTDELTKILTGASLVILILAALAGYIGVRRSLRPLHTIESTAKAIATGDLSQRIPTMPARTEVGSLAASLNVMLSRIEEAFDTQTRSEARMRQFVSDASHELRTPLVTIRGYSELFRMGGITTDQQIAESMQRIEGSALQMTRLVESLLALARLDEASPMRTEEVDLTEVAHHTLADLNAIDPTRPTKVIPINDGTGPHHVVGDPTLLRQVLTNLIGNITEHTPTGTAVDIAIGSNAETGGVVVEVRDHGPGIPAEHHDRVFERFHRVDASRSSASGGSGLGLAIVASIIAAHHGTVRVQDTPGGGTTIKMELPRTQPAPQTNG